MIPRWFRNGAGIELGVSGEYSNEVPVGYWWGFGANLARKSVLSKFCPGVGRDDFFLNFGGWDGPRLTKLRYDECKLTLVATGCSKMTFK